METSEEGYFRELPTDLKKYLFSFLSRRELGLIRLSCKSLQNIIDAHSAKFVIRVVPEPDGKKSFRLSELITLLQKAPEQTRKKIYRVEFVKAYSREVTDLLPNLKSIEWKDLDEESKVNIYFPEGILKLYLEYVNIDSHILQKIPLSLTTLLLETIDCINYDENLHFLSKLENLQKLQVRSAKFVQGKFINFLSPTLKTLYIWFCENMVDISGLTRLSRLTNLDLTNGVITNESIIQYLPRSLRKLCLYSLPNVTSDGIVKLPNLLTSLELNGGYHLEKIYYNFPTTLRVLRLKSCLFHGSKVVFPPDLRDLQLEALQGNLTLCLKSLPTKIMDLHLDRSAVSLSELEVLPMSLRYLNVSYYGDQSTLSQKMDEATFEGLVETYRKQGRHLRLSLGYKEHYQYKFKDWSL